VSIHPLPTRAGHDLDAVLTRAGVIRGDHLALHFGSAAGELAACVTRVGLADRSDLATFALEGPPAMLESVTTGLTGATLAPGGTLPTGSAWWCAAAPERVLVVVEAGDRERMHARIGRLAARHPALRIRDLSSEWGAIALVGRRAGAVLARLGVYGESGDPRSAAPVGTHPVAGAQVTWVLQSDDRALALMTHREAPQVWHALHAAGRPFGICAVGQEAVVRYSLLTRARPGT
jgi:glycine cleavage system aminomethyltransferase T